MKLNSGDAELAACLWAKDDVPVREVDCRHCSDPNEVRLDAALFASGACECGSCSKPLFLGASEPLTGLSSSTYQHSLDKKSIAALSSLPGFGRLTKWILKQTAQRRMQVMLLASSVRCSADQFPELVALLEKARVNLGLPDRPELFLSEAADANAYTTGADKHVVVVFSGLLDIADDRQLLAILGHELGHIHAEHVTNSVMARLLSQGLLLATGVGALVAWPLTQALLSWQRCAELTADRAALLASRDLRASVEIFMSFAGGNRPGVARRTRLSIGPFVRQARELAQLEANNPIDGLAAILLTMNASHPFPAWRLMHLLQWAEKGSYLDILAGHYPRRAAAS